MGPAPVCLLTDASARRVRPTHRADTPGPKIRRSVHPGDLSVWYAPSELAPHALRVSTSVSSVDTAAVSSSSSAAVGGVESRA
jgi:hypothetical protein